MRLCSAWSGGPAAQSNPDRKAASRLHSAPGGQDKAGQLGDSCWALILGQSHQPKAWDPKPPSREAATQPDQPPTSPPLPGCRSYPASGCWSQDGWASASTPRTHPDPSVPPACLCPLDGLTLTGSRCPARGQTRKCPSELFTMAKAPQAPPRRTETDSPDGPKGAHGSPTVAKCCMGSLAYSMVGARESAHAGELACHGTRHGAEWPGGKGQSGSHRVGPTQAGRLRG